VSSHSQQIDGTFLLGQLDADRESNGLIRLALEFHLYGPFSVRAPVAGASLLWPGPELEWKYRWWCGLKPGFLVGGLAAVKDDLLDPHCVAQLFDGELVHPFAQLNGSVG
jgi:hypothetical protein